MQLSQNPQVLDVVVRMVIPMRREFGCAVDVQVFMRDAVYAQQVLRQALTSQVQRLREYAEVVQRSLRATPAVAQASAPVRPRPVAMDGAFLSRRRESVRQLLNLVGPVAEPMCMKLEQAATPEALQALLDMAQQLVAHHRGGATAQRFRANLAAPPGAR